MNYIDCIQSGGPEVLTLKEGPSPQPREGEVLIQVHAAGVNRPDIAGRKGLYPPPPGASPILGLEVSGLISECGPHAGHWKKGDAVCALVPGGGYAEFCIAPALHTLPIPKNLSFEQAAGIPENFFTVWTNVFDRGQLKKGEIFLVHGGSSGIGIAAIQLAKRWGAFVITTAGSDKKCDVCLNLGADLAINYKTHNFVSEVKHFTKEKGVHLILDMVGGPYFQKNLDCLAPEGRLVQIAFQMGADVPLNLSKIMSKRLTITGSTLRPRSIQEKGEIAKNLHEKIWPLFESQQIQVLIDRVFPLAQVAQAHQLMESSEHIGKIILRVRD